jgi:hypothetical protein
MKYEYNYSTQMITFFLFIVRLMRYIIIFFMIIFLSKNIIGKMFGILTSYFIDEYIALRRSVLRKYNNSTFHSFIAAVLCVWFYIIFVKTIAHKDITCKSRPFGWKIKVRRNTYDKNNKAPQRYSRDIAHFLIFRV